MSLYLGTVVPGIDYDVYWEHLLEPFLFWINHSLNALHVRTEFVLYRFGAQQRQLAIDVFGRFFFRFFVVFLFSLFLLLFDGGL